jgi:cytochrome c biogenesis protein CcmG/thiol:disulfide interchange protein DsbE
VAVEASVSDVEASASGRQGAPVDDVEAAPAPRRALRWVLAAAGVGVVGLTAVLALTVSSDPRADATRSRLVGRPAPEFAMTGVDGTPIRSADLAGRTVVVSFWNSWCLPCREEEPVLRRFWARNRDDPATALVAITRDDTDRAARAAVRRRGITWPVGIGPGARRATVDFGTRGQPETYVIGPDGIVAGAYFGPLTEPVLAAMLARARGVG